MADFDKTTALTWDDEGVIEKAIEDAYQRGRRDGLEEAAQCAELHWHMAQDDFADGYNKAATVDIPGAIRKRCEEVKE